MITKISISMVFVYDFDATLYRTGEMWKFWISLLQEQGYPKERAEEKGPLVFWEGFTPERHLLEIDPGCSREIVQNLGKAYRDHIQSQKDQLLFPEVVGFLSSISKEQQIIMTHGDPEFQKYKVETSGATKFVREVQISRPEKRKVDLLAELVEKTDEEVVFIENNPRELREVLEASLPITLIRMSREGERHSDEICLEDGKKWKVVTSLEQI